MSSSPNSDPSQVQDAVKTKNWYEYESMIVVTGVGIMLSLSFVLSVILATLLFWLALGPVSGLPYQFDITSYILNVIGAGREQAGAYL
jgi:hypothetical protein